MRQILSTVQRYDSRTVCLHWLTAGLVITLWCLGQTIDWFPRGSARIFARSTHIGLGALLALIVLVRIWWRSTAGERLAPLGSRSVQSLAKSMHIALYLVLPATVALGLANTWVRGDNLFNLYRIPSFAPGDKALRASVEDYHAFAANLLLIMAALHAAAGLAHQYFLKDGTLNRMLPTRTRS
jgi:cytochrome b561